MYTKKQMGCTVSTAVSNLFPNKCFLKKTLTVYDLLFVGPTHTLSTKNHELFRMIYHSPTTLTWYLFGTALYLSSVTHKVPFIICGGMRNPNATPSWFPKTPKEVAVEISLAGNQIEAIFGGSSKIKHCAHAETVWPINTNHHISSPNPKHFTKALRSIVYQKLRLVELPVEDAGP